MAPDASKLSKYRKRIYRLRYLISIWSHQLFRLSRRTKNPKFSPAWARLVASTYHGLADHQRKLAEIKKRFVQLGP